jgi:hypothetical protein
MDSNKNFIRWLKSKDAVSTFCLVGGTLLFVWASNVVVGWQGYVIVGLSVILGSIWSLRG